MTCDFKDMLILFASAVTGKTPGLDHSPDVEAVRSLAISQSVWQTVFVGLSKLYEAGGLDITEKRFAELRQEVLLSVADRIRKNAFTSSVLASLPQAGVEYCLLKGESVARLYANPECRVSSDVDILISPDDAGKVSALLEEKGYEVEPATNKLHHFGARHTLGGLLEVHTKMYQSETEELVLQGKFRYGQEYISDGEHPQLGIDDGLQFLTAHLLKHFITGAAGLRQIADLIVYANHYKDKINWEGYNALMKEIRFHKFISSVFGIGNNYFGFSFETGVYDDASEALLDDTEYAGNFGNNDREVLFSFYRILLADRTGMTNDEYDKKYYKSDNQSTVRKFFPRYETFRREYPFAKPWMVPGLWLHRSSGKLWALATGKRNLYYDKYDKNPVIKKRIELARRLEFM